MANEIQIFNNPQFGEIRTLADEANEPLFCAKDVATALGYADTADAIQRHCKSGKKVFHPHANGIGGVNMVFITEKDVYRLIMRSNLPDAEKFQDWVCDDVLPSIRKTGQYSVKPLTQGQMLVQMAQAYEAQERMLLEQQRRQSIIEHKVEVIENRIENNGFMSVMGFANIHHLNIGTKAAAAIGRLASKWCKRNLKRTEKTKHERWGEVNTYPMEALRVCFAEFYPDKTF